MVSITAAPGSAQRQAELWGARARDWAQCEEQQLPTYREGARRARMGPGQRVLDAGCGSGVFLRLAADVGADVFGLDGSAALLDIARERVPEADLRTGEMQFLPYEDDSFDVVAGFNAFFFAADMVAALREARRVAKPGAPVIIQVWGRPERCDLTAMKAALRPLLPAGAGAPAPLYRPGVLEHSAVEAGLTPDVSFDLTYAFEYPDEQVLARRMLAAGMVVEVLRRHDEGAVRSAVLEALAPYRTPGGTYRLENEWHYLIARA